MNRCPRCGYHLTQLALTIRCDACDGLVPRPARKRLTLASRINPKGLRGDDIYRWLVERKGETLRVRSSGGVVYNLRYHMAPDKFLFEFGDRDHVERRLPGDFDNWEVI